MTSRLHKATWGPYAGAGSESAAAGARDDKVAALDHRPTVGVTTLHVYETEM